MSLVSRTVYCEYCKKNRVKYHECQSLQLAAAQAEIERLKQQRDIAAKALEHYSNRDNWVGDKYRGTIHGPAVAETALAAIRELEGK